VGRGRIELPTRRFSVMQATLTAVHSCPVMSGNSSGFPCGASSIGPFLAASGQWLCHDRVKVRAISFLMLHEGISADIWYLRTKKNMEFAAIYQLFKDKGHPFGN
jgi:hypothetical protein